ncbi:MAG: hypothetical protein ACM3JD_15030, partial [Rudaea sp.]
MPLPLTNLDTRRWTDLAQEAQAMIPRYAPAWTDHNSSDPGITTLQLLAWLVEQDVYRLNRVPASHIRKFLALIGVRPLPPQPSQLVVSVMPTGTTPVDLPEGTEIAATSSETRPLLFTLQEPVQAVPASLVALLVQAAPDAPPVDNTRHWREQGSIAALGGDPAPGAALWFGFDRPLPKGEAVRLALAFGGGRSGAEERARIIAEEAAQAEACHPALPPAPDCAPAPAEPPAPSQPPTLQHHSVRLVWEYYVGGKWQALDPDSGEVWDDTRGLTLDGMVEIALPADMDSLDPGTGAGLYFLRVRFQSGDYDTAPLLADVALNAVALEQSTAVS